MAASLVGNLNEQLTKQDKMLKMFKKDINPDAKYILFNRTAGMGSEQSFIVLKTGEKNPLGLQFAGVCDPSS